MIATALLTTAGQATPLTDALEKHQNDYAHVLPDKYINGKLLVLDVSKQSEEFKNVDIHSSKALIEHSNALKKKHQADMMIGRYLEDRNIYKRNGKLYKSDEEPRSVHLGMDLMVPADTAVYAPLAGKVHSFRDNKGAADYGPTIILEHKLDGIVFYTLYGHLSRSALPKLKVGQKVAAHQQIATVGQPFENGGWPTHLHFQIIDNMRGEEGHFIGVIQPSLAKQYALICPDPNLILQLPI